METVLLPGTNVKGDITSCKIENQLIATHRNFAFSIQETNTYASYDVCSKQIIQQYTVPDITDFGIVFSTIGIVVLCVGLFVGVLAWVSKN